MARILIVDDERSIRNALKDVLEFEGYAVDLAEDGGLLIHVKACRKDGYVFSFIFDGNKEAYSSLEDTNIPALISDNKGQSKEVSLYCHLNHEFEEIETRLRKMFMSNRPQSSYYDIPFYRRVVDVYLDIDKPIAMQVKVDQIPGRICIPVWNLVSEGKPIHESRHRHADSSLLSPYGLSGDRNQYVITFENLNSSFSGKLLDALVEICDYDCRYMISQLDFGKDGSAEDIRLYTSDKKVLEHKFSLFGLMNPKEDYAYLENHRKFDGLSNAFSEFRLQKSLSLATLHYYVNIFKGITGLELDEDAIKTDSKSGIYQLGFLVKEKAFESMAEEYMDFLIEMLNSVFLGHRFEGRVIRHV